MRGFDEIAQAIKASPAATDQDKLLLCLPDIARAEAEGETEPDATGWAQLAAFLRKWFGGPASTDRSAQAPAYVTWDWLLQYSRAATLFDNLSNPLQLFTVSARDVLAGYLQADGLLSGDGGEFDYTDGAPDALHPRQFQYLASAAYPTLDGLTACIGMFTFYALAKGSTAPTAEGWSITVTGVSIFLRDGFDFEDDQGLAHWDCEDLGVTMLLPTNVHNADFRAFRDRHERGGDFWVYALPREIDDFEEYVYEI